jgi:4-diphosphocytidyl-2-C-methyl-D-erythritol kinase
MAKRLLKTIKANAKINWFLHIVGKRPNGYHNLESLFSPVAIYDELSFYEADEDDCEIVNGPVIEDNLVLRVIKFIKEQYNIKDCFKVEIEKNIPIGGGLGGGSSNCAATILFLNDYLKLNLARQKLVDIGESFGADVPFFIVNQTAFVEGIGEIITKQSFGGLEFNLLVVTPKIAVNTAMIFKSQQFAIHPKIAKNEIAQNILTGTNDLEVATTKLYPSVGTLIADLKTQEGAIFARMSGSGSSCIAVFDSYENLQKAHDNFQNTGNFCHMEVIVL